MSWQLKLSAVVVAVLAVTTAGPAGASERPERAASGIGAGINAPKYNDGGVQYRYTCDDYGNFKIKSAKLVMWSRGGNRVKGFHFKYKVVPTGPGIAPQSNWSDNVSTSFDQGTVRSIWMKAGSQGQAWNPNAGPWAFQIKLKYPRSLRTAWRYKYKREFPAPACGYEYRSGGSGRTYPGNL